MTKLSNSPVLWLAIAIVVAAPLMVGCGAAQQSEGSSQDYRPAALGVQKPARPACTTAVSTAARSYAAVVRTRAVIRSRPGGGRILQSFGAVDQNGYPTVLGVVGRKVGRGCTATWYQVELPVKPNGSTGWVRAGAVRTYAVATRVVVDLSSRQLVAYRAGKPVLRTRVAVGAAQTPTPVGRFYINERFILSDPNGPFGVAALGISAHSNVLSDWVEGGPIALHGTNEPASIGLAVSHGCVRLSNVDMRRLLPDAPAGTPVLIRE